MNLNRLWLIITLTTLAMPLTTFSQRLFSTEVNGLTRSYLLVNPVDDTTKDLPLIVVLHDDYFSSLSLARLNYSKLSHPAILVFPVGIKNQWTCNSDSLRRDESFLLKLIFNVQSNFKTDASRTFLIGIDDSFCFANYFSKKHSAIIRTAAQWKPANPRVAEVKMPFDSIVVNSPHIKRLDTKSDKTSFEFEKHEDEDEFKKYAGHSTLLFRLGRWQQMPASKTDFDSLTLTDLSERHFLFGAQLGFSFTEHWLAYLECDFLIIPKEQNINSITIGGGQGLSAQGSGSGGIVIPYGAGVRYAFLKREEFRPFVAASVGTTYLYAKGGQGSFSLGTGQSSTTNEREERVLRYSLTTGFDFRMGRATSFQFTASYTTSSQIEPPLASVNRFEGISIMVGLLFILGKK